MKLQKASATLKQTAIMLVFILALAGCATYKYEKAADPYKGYVVKRNDYLIPEYTVDTKNKAPEDLTLAQARFKRRHCIIDDYYKKMGRIENQFKVLIVDYPISMLTLVTAALRLPFIVISDYRYENNPQYRERVDKRDAALDKREEEKRDSLQNSLNKYIKKDLENEPPTEVTK